MAATPERIHENLPLDSAEPIQSRSRWNLWLVLVGAILLLSGAAIGLIGYLRPVWVVASDGQMNRPSDVARGIAHAQLLAVSGLAIACIGISAIVVGIIVRFCGESGASR